LAAGGFVLVAVIVVLTLVAFRRNSVAPISLRIAIRIGFVALVGSVLVGALMIARGVTLVFTGDPQAAYTRGGALKPTHAVMMHAILVLPALARLLSFVKWTEQRRLGVVLVAAAGYTVLAGVVTIGPLVGLELRQVPSVAEVLFAGGVVLLLAIGLVVIRAMSGADRQRH
jgi:hypothetical protein